MKQSILFSIVLLLLSGSFACRGQITNKEAGQANSAKIIVYYFHFTDRCATCMAVEENARKAVYSLFPDEVKSGKYSFDALNLDESGPKAIADKLGIGGQSLVVVKGDKKIDITTVAFMNAKNLDRIKQEVKSAIEKVL